MRRDDMQRLSVAQCAIRSLAGARRLELRVRVAHGGQIRRARPRVQLGEQAVVARVRVQLATRLFGSLMSPNTIAWVGQAAWQAVTISPSRICRSSSLAVMRAWLMRCTQ